MSSRESALERQRLVNERSTAWEHILWCSVMWSGFAELESKWFDHQLCVSRPSDLVYRADQAEDFLQEQFFGRVQTFTYTLNRLLDQRSQDWALGPPGTEGEPAKVQHFAKKFVLAYEEILDWAASVRGATVPDSWRMFVEATASTVDSFVEALRDVFDGFVRYCTQIPELVERGEPIRFRLTLTLDFHEGALDVMMEEYKKLI